jgi:hypothetical protein
MNNKINVTIRMEKDKIEDLKEIARKRSYKEKINITYNDLIVSSTLKEYFNEKPTKKSL